MRELRYIENICDASMPSGPDDAVDWKKEPTSSSTDSIASRIILHITTSLDSCGSLQMMLSTTFVAPTTTIAPRSAL